MEGRIWHPEDEEGISWLCGAIFNFSEQRAEMPLGRRRKMLQKDDLDRTLKLWGPIRSPISKKSVELWGKIDPEAVVNLYRMLSKGLVTSESVALKRKNKNRTHDH